MHSSYLDNLLYDLCTKNNDQLMAIKINLFKLESELFCKSSIAIPLQLQVSHSE